MPKEPPQEILVRHPEKPKPPDLGYHLTNWAIGLLLAILVIDFLVMYGEGF